MGTRLSFIILQVLSDVRWLHLQELNLILTWIFLLSTCTKINLLYFVASSSLKKRGHVTQTIDQTSELYALFLDIPCGRNDWLCHYWILFIVHPASDMKFAEYMVVVSCMPSSLYKPLVAWNTVFSILVIYDVLVFSHIRVSSRITLSCLLCPCINWTLNYTK